MAYVICEPCIGTKDTACVDVCPVDCIHPRKNEDAFGSVELLYIHPDECIDCGACVPACPVEAMTLVSANDPSKPRKRKAVVAEDLCLGVGQGAAIALHDRICQCPPLPGLHPRAPNHQHREHNIPRQYLRTKR